MRFTIALDERDDRDEVVDVKDVRFVLDPFTRTVVRDRVQIFYNPARDSFSVAGGGEDFGGC